MGAFKGVIFDFDGTLYSQKLFPFYCVLRSPADASRMQAERFVRKALKGREWDSAAAMEKEFADRMAGFSGARAEDLGRWRVEEFPRIMADVLRARCSARDGAGELLLSLSGAGIKTAVLSDYGLVDVRMDAIGLGGEVLSSLSGIFSSQDFACLKPSPRAFLKTAETMQVPPSECLVVGDRDDTDGEGARKCGMGFVLIAGRKACAGGRNTSAMIWKDFVTWAYGNLI